MTSTIKEIRDQLALIQSIEELEAHVANEDTRKGVQKAIESVSYTHLTLPTICSV